MGDQQYHFWQCPTHIQIETMMLELKELNKEGLGTYGFPK